jgi:hypothetical protein
MTNFVVAYFHNSERVEGFVLHYRTLQERGNRIRGDSQRPQGFVRGASECAPKESNEEAFLKNVSL